MKSTLAIVLATAFLAACAAPSAMRVSGGDQSQGTVTMSYDYNLMQKPSVNWQEGLQKAAAKCREWGYAGSVPSGDPAKSCKTETEGGDCIAWTLSADFQCTGGTQQQ